MNAPYTLFLSDTHLQASTPKANLCFIKLMQQQASKADAVYILGDLFEYWIGDDDNSAFNEQIKTSLWQLSQSGVPVYILCGNRDFLLGQQFAGETGVTLLSDPHVIECYDQRILLMHGDSLCTDDIKHQAFRRKTHNKLYRSLFCALPLWLRRKLAERIRHISYQRGQRLDNTIMDVSEAAVTMQLEKHQPDLLIHGHTHRPDVHQHRVNGKTLPRIVLDSWHQHGNFLKVTPTEPPQMINLSFT